MQLPPFYEPLEPGVLVVTVAVCAVIVVTPVSEWRDRRRRRN